LTIEPDLARLDSSASRTLNKIIKGKNINTLNENDIAVIAVFLAIQFVRTKEHRLRFKEISKLFTDKIKELGFSGTIAEEVGSDNLIGKISCLA
jgi:hypothetical protein